MNKEEHAQRWLKAHQLFCDFLIEEAQSKLARTLTQAEQQAIRELKSFLLLEVFERALLAAQTSEETEQWLVTLIKASRERNISS